MASVQDIEAQAHAELEAEALRTAVDQAKDRMRHWDARPWWKRLFPYSIKIERAKP